MRCAREVPKRKSSRSNFLGECGHPPQLRKIHHSISVWLPLPGHLSAADLTNPGR
jgi:hypothetical protein